MGFRVHGSQFTVNFSSGFTRLRSKSFGAPRSSGLISAWRLGSQKAGMLKIKIEIILDRIYRIFRIFVFV
jgi:hypothetical protein